MEPLGHRPAPHNGRVLIHLAAECARHDAPSDGRNGAVASGIPMLKSLWRQFKGRTVSSPAASADDWREAARLLATYSPRTGTPSAEHLSKMSGSPVEVCRVLLAPYRWLYPSILDHLAANPDVLVKHTRRRDRVKRDVRQARIAREAKAQHEKAAADKAERSARHEAALKASNRKESPNVHVQP